jgi:CRISPR-associated protein Cas5d
MGRLVDIKVWGDYACFTRPEFKVERVSYPVMTPSAARGVLEAIYWKPQFTYRIRRIGILDLGTQMTLLRNELSSRQSPGPKNRSPSEHYLLIDDDRQQRTSLVLKDVAYRIDAWIELRSGETNIGKHLDCFQRRAGSGAYHHKPYLGCREFAADFEIVQNSHDEPDATLNLPIGTMLLDTAYIEDEEWYAQHLEDRLEFWRHGEAGRRIAKGRVKRVLFNATVNNGWLTVPQDSYTELGRLEARNEPA